MSRTPKHAENERLDREESEAFITSWRARQPASPARGHIPFVGHRHMGDLHE